MSRWPVEKLLGDKVAAAMWLPWARNRLRGMKKYVSGKWLINTWKPVADVTVQCIKRPVGADEIRIWALQKLGLGFLFDNAENTEAEPSPTRTLLGLANGTWGAKLANLQRPATNGSAAANVDWVSANGQTVLNWAGPTGRYFGEGSGDTLYTGGAILTQCPADIAGAAVLDTWIVVACYAGIGITVYAKPRASGNSSALYDDDTQPNGWRTLASNAFANAQKGMYFNRAGTECCAVTDSGDSLLVGTISIDTESHLPVCVFSGEELGQTGITQTATYSGMTTPQSEATEDWHNTSLYWGYELLTGATYQAGEGGEGIVQLYDVGNFGCNFVDTGDYESWARAVWEAANIDPAYDMPPLLSDDTTWIYSDVWQRTIVYANAPGDEQGITIGIIRYYQTSKTTYSWFNWGSTLEYSGSLAVCADYRIDSGSGNDERLIGAITPSGGETIVYEYDTTTITTDMPDWISYPPNEVVDSWNCTEGWIGEEATDNVRICLDTNTGLIALVAGPLSVPIRKMTLSANCSSTSGLDLHWTTIVYVDLRYGVAYIDSERRQMVNSQGRYLLVDETEITLTSRTAPYGAFGGYNGPHLPASVGTSTVPYSIPGWQNTPVGQGLIAIDVHGNILLSDWYQYSSYWGGDEVYIDALVDGLDVIDPLTLLADLGYSRGSTEQSTLYGIAYLGEQSAAS